MLVTRPRPRRHPILPARYQRYRRMICTSQQGALLRNREFSFNLLDMEMVEVPL